MKKQIKKITAAALSAIILLESGSINLINHILPLQYTSYASENAASPSNATPSVAKPQTNTEEKPASPSEADEKSNTFDFAKVIKKFDILHEDRSSEITKEDPLEIGEEAIFRFSYRLNSKMRNLISDDNFITFQYQLPDSIIEITSSFNDLSGESFYNEENDTLSYNGTYESDGSVTIETDSVFGDYELEDEFYIDIPLIIDETSIPQSPYQVKFQTNGKTYKKNLFLNLGEQISLMSAESDFVIDENGVLLEYNGSGGDVVIPDGVTKISEPAFRLNSSITSVYIPDSVTEFEPFAFYKCTSLKSVRLPDNLTEITTHLFDDCYDLESINLYEGIKTIGNCAFRDNYALSEIQFPKSLETIGLAAFEGCRELKNVHIPDNITNIQGRAFNGCTALTEVRLPKELKRLESGSFAGCGFSQIDLPNTLIYIGSGALGSCENLTSLEIPDSVTEIGGGAFAYCRNLTSIKLPPDITYLGNSTFNGCDLREIAIPDKVKEIGDSCFAGCSKLETIVLPDSLEKLGENFDVFQNCHALKKVVIPKATTYISPDAFLINPRPFPNPNGSVVIYCYKDSYAESYAKEKEIPYFILEDLTEKDFIIDENGVLLEYNGNGGDIVIPDGVTKISESAFRLNSSITSVYIPNSVTEFEPFAFYKCTSLKSVRLPDNLTEITTHLFDDCYDLESINLYEGIKKIGNCAFWNNYALSEIQFPESLETIGLAAFEGCRELKSVYIPDNVTNIQGRAFGGCTALTKVRLPKELKRLESGSFAGCGFSQIDLPDTLTYIGSGSLSSCENLTSLEIPDSVTEINGGAFAYCINLASVKLPPNITYLGNSTFNGCDLREITIPHKVKEIGDSCFAGCSKLETIVLPESLEKLGENFDVFQNCHALKKVVIPKATTYISPDAFLINPRPFPNPNGSVVIYCYKDSYAESYAKEKEIPYRIIEDSEIIPEDAVYNSANGHWYKLYSGSNEINSWSKAKNECERIGGYLMTVTSADEQIFLKQISQNEPHIWLGGTDEEHEGQWKWITGEKFSYTNWIPGEPNNDEGREHYMIAGRHMDYKWDDRFNIPTNGPYAFICEWGDVIIEKENIPLKLPKLSPKSAKAFLGFLYNKSDIAKKDLSDDKFFCLLTGEINDMKEQYEIGIDFLAVLNERIESHIKKASHAQNYLSASLITYLEKQLNDNDNLSQEIFNEYCNHYLDKIKDSLLDELKYASGTYSGIYISDEHIQTMKEVFSSYKNVISTADKIEKFIEATYSIGEFSLLILNNEYIGRYTYFNEYLSLRNIFEPNEAAFNFALEAERFILCDNYWMGGFLDWIPGTSSWKKNAQAIEEWAEYTYQLQLSLTEEKNTTLFSDGNYQYISIQCPVDVFIKNQQDDVIGYITSKEIENFAENEIYLNQIGDSKMICLKNNSNYNIELIATENGLLTYSCRSIQNHIETERINYYNLELLTDDGYIASNIRNEQYEILSLLNSPEQKLSPSEKITNTEKKLTVKIITNDNGEVLGEGTYIKGDYVVLQAIPDNNKKFIGWYKNNICISTKPEFGFSLFDNVTYTAIFQNINDPAKPEHPNIPIVSNRNHTAHSANLGSWIKDNTGWWYRKADGSYPVNTWCLLPYNGVADWYYFNEFGYMITGWFSYNGRKYYLNPLSNGFQGKMLTGWQLIDGKWYYFNEISDGTKGALMTNTRIGIYDVDENGVWIEY